MVVKPRGRVTKPDPEIIPEEIHEEESHLPDRPYSDVPTGGKALERRIARGRVLRFHIPTDDDTRKRFGMVNERGDTSNLNTRRGHRASHIMRPQAQVQAPTKEIPSRGSTHVANADELEMQLADVSVLGEIAGGDNVTVETLNGLKAIFESADTDGTGSLEEDEFVEAFQEIPAFGGTSNSRKSIVNLFRMVDANCDGSVDWDEFSNHIMLNQARKLELTKEEEESMDAFHYIKAKSRGVPGKAPKAAGDKPDKTGEKTRAPGSSGPFRRQGQHMDLITRILYLPTISSYVTSSRDGDIRQWTPQLAPGRVINVSKHWITDMTQREYQPLAVASMDRSISFYDAHHPSMSKLCSLTNMDEIPMSIHWLGQVEGDMLMVGDDRGKLHMLRVEDVWGTKGASLEDDSYELTGMTRLDPIKLHNDWITKIRYMHWTDAVATCSMDSKLQCYDLQRAKPKWTASGHRHGVYSFDVCRSYNFIASCGSERDILLWNPFMGSPVGVVSGHLSSVQDVMVSEADRQMISISTDHKEIKVWDIRMFRCIQTIVDNKPTYSERFAAFALNSPRKCLVTGSMVPELRPRQRVRDVTNPPIVRAVYNRAFGSVVVGTNAYDVNVYDAKTGSNTFSFQAIDNGSKMSAMSLDLSERRLVTGGEDGAVRIWNFNNGNLLGQFVGNAEEEICTIQCVQDGRHKYVLAGGWAREVCVWEDAAPEMGAMAIEPQRELRGGHGDDVLCMCYCAGPTPVLASGGYDGKIVLWKLDAAVIKATLIPPHLQHTNMDDRPVEGMVYIAKKDILASAGMDGMIRFWRLGDSRLTYSLNARHDGGGVSAIAVTPDATRMFTSDHRGFVKAWDMTTADFSLNFRGTPDGISLSSPSLDHDATQIVRHTASRHNKVTPIYTLQCHGDPVTSVDMCGAEFFITSSSDGTAKLWHLGGRLVGVFGYDSWSTVREETWTEEAPSFYHPDPEFAPIEEEIYVEDEEKREERLYKEQLLDIQLQQVCTSRNGAPGMVRKLSSQVQSHVMKLPLQDMVDISPDPLAGMWNDGRQHLSSRHKVGTARSRIKTREGSRRNLRTAPARGSMTARF